MIKLLLNIVRIIHYKIVTVFLYKLSILKIIYTMKVYLPKKRRIYLFFYQYV